MKCIAVRCTICWILTNLAQVSIKWQDTSISPAPSQPIPIYSHPKAIKGDFFFPPWIDISYSRTSDKWNYIEWLPLCHHCVLPVVFPVFICVVFYCMTVPQLCLFTCLFMGYYENISYKYSYPKLFLVICFLSLE